MDRETKGLSFGRYQGETSVYGRSGLIGVTLHLGGDTKDPVEGRVLPMGAQGRRGPGHIGGGRRSKPTCQGHIVRYLEGERAVANGLAGRRRDAICFAHGDPVLTVVLDDPFFRWASRDHTARAQGQGDSVEGRTEIGRRGRGGCGCSCVHVQTLSTVPLVDLFDFENLLPELILALGLALLIGNGLAWWKHRQGETPKEIPEAMYRPGRVRFLMIVGVLLTIWGAVTLFT